MKAESKEALLALGMDIDQTLARFVGNEALLFKFLRKFQADGSYQQLANAVAEKNGDEGFRAAHTLKGVAGNLGLGSLFTAVSPLVETLRAGETETADAMFAEVTKQYELAMTLIAGLTEP